MPGVGYRSCQARDSRAQTFFPQQRGGRLREVFARLGVGAVNQAADFSGEVFYFEFTFALRDHRRRVRELGDCV